MPRTPTARKSMPFDLEVLSCCDEAHCSMRTTSCGRELVFDAGTIEDKCVIRILEHYRPPESSHM